MQHPVTEGAHALERVRNAARLYFDSKRDSDRNRDYLAKEIRAARQHFTQEKIAQACRFNEDEKLTRQRFAQIE